MLFEFSEEFGGHRIIHCDNDCQKSFSNEGKTDADVRELAFEQGWVTATAGAITVDWCPECSDKFLEREPCLKFRSNQ